MKMHLYFGRDAVDRSLEEMQSDDALAAAHPDLVVEGITDVVWTFGGLEIVFDPSSAHINNSHDSAEKHIEAIQSATGWNAGVRDYSLSISLDEDLIRVSRTDAHNGMRTTYFSDFRLEA